MNYSVTTNSRIEDLGLWRTIINGYPYKSLEELGVLSEEEAFTATKQAVYCYLYGNSVDDYEAIEEAGQRTLNALRNIVFNAENSNENQLSKELKVITENEDWVQDADDTDYISKTYYLNSSVDNLEYIIINNNKLPKGTKIVNMNNTECLEFKAKEKFKIKLLKSELKNDGEINLDIHAQVKTKPVLYGASPDPSWQNYAITTYMYEDSECSLKDNYKRQQEPKKEKKIKEGPKETIKILPETGM